VARYKSGSLVLELMARIHAGCLYDLRTILPKCHDGPL
jgi:hypothetical protein